MPRSLIELRRTLPGITLLPHAVVSNKIHAARWWSDPFTARVLMGEYVKLLPSAARYGAARLLRWDEGTVVARKEAARG
jgi:hypothetical protein